MVYRFSLVCRDCDLQLNTSLMRCDSYFQLLVTPRSRFPHFDGANLSPVRADSISLNMKSRRDGGKSETGPCPATRAQSTPFKKRQHKHTKRLGGGGLSLEAFAAAKSKPFVSPAQIRENRERYTNAKKVQKYKKLVAQLGGHDRVLKDEEAADIPGKVEEKETANDKSALEKRGAVGFPSRKLPLLKTHGKQYKHRRKQLEQPKDISQVDIVGDKFQKNEFEEKVNDVEELHGEQQQAREKVKHDDKLTQVRLRKRTQRGQPVMKHQMERLLEVIQRSS